jgi:hypothetical protein
MVRREFVPVKQPFFHLLAYRLKAGSATRKVSTDAETSPPRAVVIVLMARMSNAIDL